MLTGVCESSWERAASTSFGWFLSHVPYWLGFTGMALWQHLLIQHKPSLCNQYLICCSVDLTRMFTGKGQKKNHTGITLLEYVAQSASFKLGVINLDSSQPCRLFFTIIKQDFYQFIGHCGIEIKAVTSELELHCERSEKDNALWPEDLATPKGELTY